MKKGYINVQTLSLSALLLLAASCTDDRYDLNKEMDLTLGIGGDHLTIPASSTNLYSMDAILNLEEGSSIKADANGDYELVENADPSYNIVSVDVVKIKEKDTERSEVRARFPQTPAGGPGQTPLIIVGGNVTENFTVSTDKLVNKIDMENSEDVPEELISASSARVDLGYDLMVDFAYENYTEGSTVKNGFTISFSPDMTVTCAEPYITVKDNHDLVFNQDVPVARGKKLHIPFKVSAINIPNGQGVMPDRTFVYRSDIVSTGTVALNPSGMVSGTVTKVDISIDSQMQKGSKVTEVTGVVNPKVDVESTKMEITDVPDFLSDPENNLDIYNPQIYLTVENTSPSTVTLDGTIRAFVNGEQTAAVDIKPVAEPGFNYICICQHEVKDEKFSTLEIVPDLSTLLNTIPDYVEFVVNRTISDNNEHIFKLGHEYEFNVEAEVKVPLSFGEGMKLMYRDSEDGWNLDDTDKLGFKTVEITATLTNTVPMSFQVSVEPQFASGYRSDVVVDNHDSKVGAGTLENPAQSEVTFTITSTDKKLTGLQGIDYLFEGSNPVTGVCLNQKQGLRFENLRINIRGGISYDAN